ncbi:hypothetical protein O6H91_06G137400 [Diphasiastrum complanatum]|uniref:Uncharacterized protein n=1 Tax=Diphasiastrum complanatum TaxID=34168 RepID=A0ACC2DJA5_DIPCM|nr:hypothetical protein O6H91_06G137400 [Diphasiastrum complanatum]
MSFQDIETNGKFSMQKDLLASTENKNQGLAAGVFQINTAVSTFRRLVNNLGSTKDTPEFREKLLKTRQHIANLVKETAKKLKEATDTDQKATVSPSKKIGDAKLAKDFESILKEFQKVQKTAAEHEVAYLPFVPQVVLPSSSSEFNLKSEDSQEKQSLLTEQRRQEVIQLENEVVFNEAVIEEREQGIREIQQQIGEVHEMFKDLAVLVQDQAILIDDIDSNLETSHSATVQANQQLVKAAKSQKSSLSLSCLMIFIFGVALFILVIVIAA